MYAARIGREYDDLSSILNPASQTRKTKPVIQKTVPN
jgi:hypothetical protein